MTDKTAIIIGAGPAGLTAAYELQKRTGIKPVIFEIDDQVGGISKTVNHKGNRIDIGGHRFFSKSVRVNDWWAEILPLQGGESGQETVRTSYQNRHNTLEIPAAGADPVADDDVMLIRPRVSRILYNQRFFDYPIKFSFGTMAGLGLWRSATIFASYLRARIRPISPENSLQDFLINRFGRALYATFFEHYTQKVWGVPCAEIPAEWGKQRIKGLSVTALIKDYLRKMTKTGNQKDVETSLIEQFLYPKFGPGQLWEKVARTVVEQGGEIHHHTRVVAVNHDNGRIISVVVEGAAKTRKTVSGDYFFSTMPVKDLIAGWAPAPPKDIRDVAGGLTYRDFITVGVLLKRLQLDGGTDAQNLREKMPDNWIYVQEEHVKVGRIQIFNNWSPHLVANPDDIWIGLEYFVNEGDEFWGSADQDLAEFAIKELGELGFCDADDVIDTVVVRTPKAYPAYFGSYARFDEVRDYVSGFDNLFCIGRNGMHRYNNQDHSMLTAMVAVDGIVDGKDTRAQLWTINTEQEYHEES